MKLTHILPLLMLPLFPATGLLAQAQDVQNRLTQVVSSYEAGDHFMGTVLVSREDRVLLNKGFGQANVQWSVPNTPEVRFRLGSVSKQFTAALILLLEQQGKLDIDDPVMLAMPQTLGPVRLDAGRPELASRLAQQPCGCGYIVGGLLNGPLPARMTS